jgi:putative SOS response-associated peptidase YedK
VPREPESGERRLEALRWGLIPFWAKDAKIAYSTFGAMAENRLHQSRRSRSLSAAAGT